MTPADALASLRGFANDLGEDVIVRRYSGTGPGRSSVSAVARARVRGFLPAELVGSVIQGDRKVIMVIDPSAIVPAGKVALSTLLPLRESDVLEIRGREVAIQSIDDNTRRIQGVLVGLDIQARG